MSELVQSTMIFNMVNSDYYVLDIRPCCPDLMLFKNQFFFFFHEKRFLKLKLLNVLSIL